MDVCTYGEWRMAFKTSLERSLQSTILRGGQRMIREERVEDVVGAFIFLLQ